MKLIIAGGRKFDRGIYFSNMISQVIQEILITEIVSGRCGKKPGEQGYADGADGMGEKFADRIGVNIKPFPADFDALGKKAGPLRNRQMAEYADAVALFPGGRGTQSMYNEAVRAGIKIFDFRNM